MSREQARENNLRKRKGWFGKCIIVAVVILNIWFVIRIFGIVGSGNQEPTATVAAWFAFTTGELFMLARIKTVKKKETNENIEED